MIILIFSIWCDFFCIFNSCMELLDKVLVNLGLVELLLLHDENFLLFDRFHALNVLNHDENILLYDIIFVLHLWNVEILHHYHGIYSNHSYNEDFYTYIIFRICHSHPIAEQGKSSNYFDNNHHIWSNKHENQQYHTSINF